MIGTDKQEYWKSRARQYGKFKWANDPSYLSAFIKACEPREREWILDVGIGTGLVAEAILPFASKIVGIDNSKDMLTQCNGKFNVMFCDARDIPYPDGSFDKIIARNVFHHITERLQDAVNECHRVLKRGRRIVIGERIAPSDETRAEYGAIFRLKDKRNIFIESHLINLIERAGFEFVGSQSHWIRGLSVKAWLAKSGLDDEAKSKIYNLHINGSDELKRAYKMKKRGGDCFIDIKNIIVIGEK
ncbi:MAG: SAM-dependent methyltransferase [Candidatus Cloacimonadota bacterium]|nr:MAG: SAM-dependent methyltransferase [Candidatus Cloacimonadota bacterium]